MGAELKRKEKGEKTKTGMSKEQLKDFAKKPGRKKVGIGARQSKTRAARSA